MMIRLRDLTAPGDYPLIDGYWLSIRDQDHCKIPHGGVRTNDRFVATLTKGNEVWHSLPTDLELMWYYKGTVELDCGCEVHYPDGQSEPRRKSNVRIRYDNPFSANETLAHQLLALNVLPTPTSWVEWSFLDVQFRYVGYWQYRYVQMFFGMDWEWLRMQIANLLDLLAALERQHHSRQVSALSCSLFSYLPSVLVELAAMYL